MLLRSDPFADLFNAPRSAEPNLASMNAFRHGDVITVEFDFPASTPRASTCRSSVASSD